jgi:hypothetical protein
MTSDLSIHAFDAIALPGPVQAPRLFARPGANAQKDPTNLAWREMAIHLTFLASIANTPLAGPTMEHEQHCNQSNTVNQIKGTYL